MPKPITGIFTCRKKSKNDCLHAPELAAQNISYIRAIEENGGLPLLIPYTENLETLSELLDLCNGFLIPGGIDVDPSFYGEAPNEKLGDVDAVLDKAELFALGYALSENKPVFGICRGLQIMNVFCGGTLYQDIPSHRQKSSRSEVSHSVNISENSIIRSVMGCESAMVNSLHHQAVRKLGCNLTVSARSEDGVVEAVEHNNGIWFAVQWHPEELCHIPEMKALFSYFISASLKNSGNIFP